MLKINKLQLNRPYGCLRGDFQAEGTGSVKVLRNSKEQCVGVEWLGEVTGDSVGYGKYCWSAGLPACDFLILIFLR